MWIRVDDTVEVIAGDDLERAVGETLPHLQDLALGPGRSQEIPKARLHETRGGRARRVGVEAR